MKPRLLVSYQIEVSPEARKEIKALAGYVRAQARQLIRAFQAAPLLLTADKDFG